MGTSSFINLLFFIPILSGSFFSGRQLPQPSFITAHHFSSYFYSTILDRNVTEKIFLINWASLPASDIYLGPRREKAGVYGNAPGKPVGFRGAVEGDFSSGKDLLFQQGNQTGGQATARKFG